MPLIYTINLESSVISFTFVNYKYFKKTSTLLLSKGIINYSLFIELISFLHILILKYIMMTEMVFLLRHQQVENS